MKKYIFILTGFFAFSSFAFAQYVEAEAKAILDKTAQAIQNSTGSKVEFSLTINNTQTSQKQTMHGTLLLKGDKFKLSIADTETYYDGKSQWVYVPDFEEVTISTPTAEELSEINPTAILSSYKKGFKLAKENDRTVDGKQAFVVNIHPEDRNKPYHRVEIVVDKSTYDIISISTFGKGGTDTTIKVKKHEKGQNFADQIFVFDPKKHPNVEVIDLR